MRKNLLVLAILICGMELSSCTDKLKKTPNISLNPNCIYVMLERCLDSDIAEFKRKVCDSPLIKFKIDSVVVLPK